MNAREALDFQQISTTCQFPVAFTLLHPLGRAAGTLWFDRVKNSGQFKFGE
jgi:hypothetical protein